MRGFFRMLIVTVLGGVGAVVFAANDPSISGDLRSNVRYSMKHYIDQNIVDGRLYLYDAVDGHLLKLSLDELHTGIVKKGDYYVSCADFTDQQGRRVDVDFLVRPKGDLLLTTQALVHSVAGKKRAYHLEN